MSHVTTVKTQLNNLDLIQNALNLLGLKTTKHSELRMWNGRTIKADIVIKLNQYDIGVKRNEDGTYRLEADSYAWGEIARSSQMKKFNMNNDQGEQFTGLLTQATNMVKAQMIAASRGQQITFTEPDENNIIHARVLEA
jgi:hypothetical protein